MNRPNNLKNIFKKIFGSENQTFRGSHIADGFTSYVSGFDNLKKVVNDSMGVHIEVDRIHNAIYPPITVPSNKPGYYSFSDEYFEFDFNDSQLKSDLTEYFLKKNYSNKIFSGTYDLGMFFQWSNLLCCILGKSYK
jgi:predicted HTH transcriptional regulator